MVRFCVNIGMVFNECDFLGRFAAAARAGFDAVEMWWPTPQDLEEVPRRVADAGIEVVRFALAHGEAGLLCMPDEQTQFERSVLEGIDFAGEVGATKISVLAGTQLDSMTRSEQLAIGVERCAWLADRAAKRGIQVLLEPNTNKAKPGYLLTTTAQVVSFLGEVDRPNTGMVYDTFHAQRGEGDLIATIRANIERIVHVQLGDAPDRHEPGTGEIRFSYVINQLLAAGYDGFIGLEYLPKTTTLEGLRWLPVDLRSGLVRREDLWRVLW